MPDNTNNVDDTDAMARELDSLQYDGVEHLAGYICYRLKDPQLYEPNQTQTYTWTDQLSEGFLKKPTKNLMEDVVQLEEVFNAINGDGILFEKQFLNNIISKANHIKFCEK